jgi:hypothetical protein
LKCVREKEPDAQTIAKCGTSAVNGKITTQGKKMKTRQELILDFMLALSSNPAMMDNDSYDVKEDANYIHHYASFLADKYLENI